MSRVDRLYTPLIEDGQITASLSWDDFKSDHAAVHYLLTSTSDIERGHDLRKINAKLLDKPEHRKCVANIIKNIRLKRSRTLES